MEFIIVTGLSGAGKSRALNALEDIGFYCVDNIPPKLIPTFYNLCQQSLGRNMERVAIVTDVRGGNFEYVFKALEELRHGNKQYKILYLDANDEILKSRYKQTRRRHPLAESYLGSVNNAIQLERQLLAHIRECSDYVVDTSYISPMQLKERITSIFLESSSNALIITCESFGFKYGLPNEADLVFDVRCFSNPYYIDELKELTGLDEKVSNYVFSLDEVNQFVDKLFPLIDYMIPLYCKEGKSQLLIAIGCTGGKHRSVAITKSLYEHLLINNSNVTMVHRDIKKM